MPRASKKSIKVREEFFKNYSQKIMLVTNINIYDAHIKVWIAGEECDYYPGANQKIDKTKWGRFNRRIGGDNNWSDLDHKDFLSFFKIEVLS